MKRILFAIPIPFGPNWGFWTRDSGLVVLALRKMGYDAWLVALGDSTTVTEGMPVLPVTLEEMRNPEWWKSQRPDAVVLSTWSAPRYDAIRKAALAATPRVIERLDTDGARSARLFPKPYFTYFRRAYADRFPVGWRWLSVPLAASRIVLLFLFPALMDRRMVATMKQLPGLIAESPVAVERMQLMFQTFSGTKHRIVMIPHPINEDVLRYTGCPKENRIITVGRWASHQKDYPMLKKVLDGFLRLHPDWKATVVGEGIPSHNPLETKLARQITYHEQLSHEQLAVEYSRSKIYLMVSGYESFCIAAAEALCCGCSVVGSTNIPTSSYFAEPQSGDVAEVRTPKAFLATLDREVESWAKGKRNPETISTVWRERAGSEAVARATLAFLEELPG
jgi:glycosyltransferase involved in cell wall biosynthesis